MQMRASGFEPCLLPTLLPNLAQIPVIAPLAPDNRQLRQKLPGTDRADYTEYPLTEHRDDQLAPNYCINYNPTKQFFKSVSLVSY